MTFFITEIIEGILLAILMTYSIWNQLVLGMVGERDIAS